MKTILLLLSLIQFSTATFACRTTKPLTDDAKASAQIVFIGRPVKFEKTPESEGQITFVTIKTLKGEHREEWVINQTFDWFKKNTTLNEFKNQYGEEIEVGVSMNTDIPVIISTGVCGTPYLIKKN